MHALLGANGAGKSTLVKLLSGNLQPDQGGMEMRAQPLRLAFAPVIRHRSTRTVGEDAVEVQTDAADRLLVNLFGPLLQAARRTAQVIQSMQTGHLSHYLGYIMVVLMGGVVWLKLSGLL